MNKIKTSKGITLIALIITIIVLLILAVVAINSVNKTGIINYAQNAVDEYAAGQKKENEAIQGYMEYLEKYDPSKKDKEDDDDEDEDNTLVAMYKAGTLKQGDYVSYSPDGESSYELASSLTGMDDSQIITRENLAWRVLGCDGANVLLISAEPTTYGLQVFGQTGYNNYESVLNNTCSALYSNSNLKATARSITEADLKTYLGVVASEFEDVEEENMPGGGTLQGYINYFGETKATLLMGPSYDVWLKDEDEITDEDVVGIFAFLISDRLNYNSKYYVKGWKHYIISGERMYGYGSSDEYYEGDNYNLRYLRPVIVLDANTTTKEVRVLQESEIPAGSWVDTYGVNEGS